MAFTPEEQARLGDIYAPVLFQSVNDVPPVSPAEYIRRAGLWSDEGPGLPAKTSWGIVPTGALPPPTFQRLPDLLPGEVAASAADPDIDARTLLWTYMSENSAPVYFLDHGGWDNQNRAPTQPLPEPGEVIEASQNLLGSIEAAKGRWSDQEPHEELDPHVGWYSVQAFDTATDRGQLRQKLLDQGDPAADYLDDTITALSGPSWLIFYHFFFPARSERVSRCEFIATLLALGLDLPPGETFFSDLWGLGEDDHFGFEFNPLTLRGILEEIGLPYSLPWAGHLGEFVTVGVVAPAPLFTGTAGGENVPSPLDVADNEFEPPIFVGYGQSAPAVDWSVFENQFLTIPIMEIASPGEFTLEGNHPRVFVSYSNHNTYPTPGDHRRPATPPMFDTLCHAKDVKPGDDLPIDKKKRRKRAAALCLMKLATLGPLMGAIACGVEASRDSALDEGPGGLDESFEESPLDVAPIGGRTLVPEDLVDAFADDSVTVRTWAGTPGERVFDERWEAENLRWGPPVLEDPFRRRQGRTMPKSLGAFIGALGRHLEMIDQ